MTSRIKHIISAGLLSLAIALPFATDAQAYGYHRFGGVFIGGPYYPYGYPAYPAYAYAPPAYAPPPYPYAPYPYPYAPPPVVAAPVVAPAIGFGVHIR